MTPRLTLLPYGLFFLLFFVLCIEISGQGDCLGNWTIATQAEIDAFDCTTYEGNITIQGADITNLNGLSELREIIGHLNINTTSLQNLNGLGNLEKIGTNLYIGGNANLTSASMPKLEVTDRGYLLIEDNPVLQTFNFPELTRVGNQTYENSTFTNRYPWHSLLIRRNENLNTLSGFPKLESVGNNLNIFSNVNLQIINDFPNLETIGRDLSISTNENLTTISGFENLERSQYFRILSNNSLNELPNFPNFSTITVDLTIDQNPVLPNFDLSRLDTVRRNVAITTNAALQNFNLPQLDNISGSFSILANDVLTEAGAPILTIIEGWLHINDHANLTAINFPELTRIGSQTYENSTFTNRYPWHSLLIQRNAGLTNLSGFPKLISVGNNLNIFNNTDLQNISDFQNLEKVGRDLVVSTNENLSTISGFENLERSQYFRILSNNSLNELPNFPNFSTITVDLTIDQNPVLPNFDLSRLDTVRRNVAITTNAALQNFNLPQLDNISGSFSILANDVLTEAGAPILTIIEGWLHINDHANLTAINFPELTRIGSQTYENSTFTNRYPWHSLLIQRNAGLTNLSGFPKLISVGNNLNIFNNTDLQNISDFQNLEKVGRDLVVSTNENLSTISGFENLKQSQYFRILSNNSLNELPNFPNFSTITVDLTIDQNPVLPNFDLSRLDTVRRNVAITTNAALQNFNLPQLDNISGSFSILANDVLTEAGAPILTIIEGWLHINDHANLTAINFPELTRIGSQTYENSTFTNRYPWHSLLIQRNAGLTNLSGFPKLISVGNNLNIFNNTDLQNISDFQNLEKVGRDLVVSTNENLSTVSGFENLERSQYFRVLSNNSLNELPNFPSFSTITVDLTIDQNPVLPNFDLTRLDTVRRNVAITTNAALQNFNLPQLDNISGSFSILTNDVLTEAGAPVLTIIEGWLHINDHTNLTAINFPELTRIGSQPYESSAFTNRYPWHSLLIQRNENLILLNGFPSLNSIGNNFLISNNNNLTNISTFTVLESIGRNLEVKNNENLTSCCGIEPILSNSTMDGVIGRSIVIEGNQFACSNEDEIVEECDGRPIDQDEDGIVDNDDNCPTTPNPNQENADNDSAGAACDCDDTPETGATCTTGCQTFYLDGDGDGFGIETDTIVACTLPDGYANVAGDCDDEKSNVFPGSLEVVDGLDNNCNDLIDEVLDCPPGNITLSTQAEVDVFNCTIVTGNLTISGEDISNLDGLSELITVNGNLTISNNVMLNDFNLPNLQVVEGWLQILDHANLLSFNLPSLIRVGSQRFEDFLGINRYPNHSIFIYRNAVLTAIDGFSALQSVGNNFHIFRNPELTSISNFDALVRVGRDFLINQNNALSSVSEFALLQKSRFVRLLDNALLEQIEFSKLDTIITLSISNNLALNELELPALSLISENFYFQNNDSLSNFSLPNLKTIEGYLQILNNQNLRAFSFPELERIGSRPFEDFLGVNNYPNHSLIIQNNAELRSIDGFSKLASIGNNLLIYLNPKLESISSFNILETIGRDLAIRQNTALNSISGFDILKRSQYFRVFDNPVLNGFEFSSLDTVQLNLNISNNAALQNLSLPALQLVGSNVSIQNNNELVDFSLPNLKIIEGHLQVFNHENLTNFSFPALERVGSRPFEDFLGVNNYPNHSLQIVGNNALTVINGFPTLGSVGNNFNITNNSSLDSLSNFFGLTFIGRNLEVKNNTELGYCCGIEPILSTSVDSIGGAIVITNNPSACSNEDEIITECDGTPIDQDDDGIVDNDDNCPTTPNPNQENADNDSAGAACDCDDTPETGAACITGCRTFYVDNDGDGFGVATDSIIACTAPEGYADNMADCDDEDGDVFPNAAGLDENCNLINPGNCNLDECSTVPIDLNTWMQEGDVANGNWGVSTDGQSLLQTINGDPTFFVSPENFINTSIRGSLRVTTSTDDDFIGFVFGYQSPNANASNYDFILFDWKQNSQSAIGYGFAPEGFSLSRINGNFANIDELRQVFWAKQSHPALTVLATEFADNNGWADNTMYNFRLDYFSNNIKIYIDDNLIFDINGNFPSGKFGFYNYSQPNVEYIGFSETVNCQTFYIDSDGDGFGNADNMTEACTAPDGFVANSDDCDDDNADITLCDPIIPCDITGDLIFTTQAQLDSFPQNCNILNGNLIINGDDITDLTPLLSLQEITGHVSIGDSLTIPSNDILETLEGLNNIRKIGGDLTICNNPMLRSLSGFSSLEEVGGSINVKNCQVLETFNWIRLRSIGGNFTILNCSSLISIGDFDFNFTFFGGTCTISGCSSLISLGGIGGWTTIGGDLYIVNCPSLPNLEELRQLINLLGCLHIINNTLIEDLAGLDSLQTIESIYITNNESILNVDNLISLTTVTGSVFISNNANLENLDGLMNLNTVMDTLEITDNPSLNNCCGIYDLLNNNGVGDLINISGNPSECSSDSEILETCVDTDEDGVADVDDNCPNDFNPDQADEDGDDIGDVCDTDTPIECDSLSITEVVSIHPSSCNTADGQINIIIENPLVEYSINNGATWFQNSVFSNLATGAYDILVRSIVDNNCTVSGGTITLECETVEPVECEFDNPLTDLAWLDSLSSNPDPCITGIRQTELDGETVFVVDYQDICELPGGVILATEIFFIIYDCEGNVICTQGFVPEPCGFVPPAGTTIWTAVTCDCSEAYNPVCVNGVTYDNACLAECEGFTADDYTEGECPCDCPTDWDPVCVGDTMTFNNACLAECEGFTSDDYTEGECMNNPETCFDLTDGGEICCNQTLCDNNLNPEPFTNISLPSGGAVDSLIEYLWIYTFDDPVLDSFAVWLPYGNSNSSEFDLDEVSQTTWIRRCARRAGCHDYLSESNIIQITVLEECPSDCDDFAIAMTIQDVSCFGAADGGINLIVEGGTLPYSFEWSNGATTEDIANLSAGIYQGTVTDANGCSFNPMATIQEPEALMVTSEISHETCDFNDGAIDISVSGGSGNYSYTWSNDSTTEDLSGLVAGDYQVTVTDALNGCFSVINATVVITDCPPPSCEDFVLEITNVTPIDCDGNLGTINLTFIDNSNDNPDVNFLWNDGATTEDRSDLSAGIYSVEMTVGDCSFNAEISLEAPNCCDDFSLEVINLIPVTCDENVASIEVAFTNNMGEMPTVNFVWSDIAENTPNRDNLAPSIYTVTVLHGNCNYTLDITIEEPTGCNEIICEDYTLNAEVTPIDCDDNLGVIDLTFMDNLGNVPMANYTWSDGATSPDRSNLEAGIYTVTVTLENCIYEMEVTLAAPDCPEEENTLDACSDGIDNDMDGLVDCNDPDCDTECIIENCDFDGLIAYYPFNGNANDESGNNNHGELGGNATANDFLVTGNNNTDRLQLPNTILSGLQELTISFNVNFSSFQIPSNNNAFGNVIISGANGQTDNEFVLVYNKNTTDFRLAVNGTQHFFGNEDLQENVWYSIVLRRLDGEFTIFLDGQSLSGTADDNSNFSISNGGLIIGQEQDVVGGGFATNQSLAGQLDNMRFFNRGLSNAEIEALINCDDMQFTNNNEFQFLSITPEILDNNDVRLRWTTLGEQDNGHHMVRHSLDSTQFRTKSDIMDAKGQSNEVQSYEWIDKNPRTGMNYYHIRHLDGNGKNYVSTVVSAYIHTDAGAVLFPNPTMNTTTLDFIQPLVKDTPVVLYNNFGQPIQEMMMPAGTIRYEIDLQDYAPGIYHVYLKKYNKRAKVLRLLKARL